MTDWQRQTSGRMTDWQRDWHQAWWQTVKETSPYHFWISRGFRYTSPAQPSSTELPCIWPCYVVYFLLPYFRWGTKNLENTFDTLFVRTLWWILCTGSIKRGQRIKRLKDKQNQTRVQEKCEKVKGLKCSTLNLRPTAKIWDCFVYLERVSTI